MLLGMFVYFPKSTAADVDFYRFQSVFITAKAILFLTDGMPTNADAPAILKTLAKLNGQLNNEVVVLTFGVGEGICLFATITVFCC